MPSRKSSDSDPDDAAHDSKHDEVDRHECVQVLGIIQNLNPKPGAANSKTVEAKYGCVYQEEQKCLVIVQTDTCRQPRTVVVHLENAATAC